ncbi:alpha/beta hydrolase [Micromonospora sp. NPDC049523]|uniref:alpha/beta hydrolase n=1 Tax=Micromonospora sp. NPDC049523 TaxID=3155921 RepID=UPI003433D03C
MTLTESELAEIGRANVSGRKPVVFVHGLWLLSSSWQRWRDLYEQAGYATIAPGWPDDPDSIEAARAEPEIFAHKMVGQVTEHYLDAVNRLDRKPALVGHSFGGLIAQQIAGHGVAAVTVAIDAAPFRGVLPVPLSSLKSSYAVLHNPANKGRAVTLSFDQFQYGWANALPADEARQLYEEFHVAASGAPIFQVVAANLNPFTEIKVDTDNPERGPLLVISGGADHTIPTAVSRAAYDRQKHNPGITEFTEIPERGHSLTIDHGWGEVAQTALDFINTHS